MDYLGATVAAISHHVLRMLFGSMGETIADVYAERVAALGLAAAPAIHALASILPGTQITGHISNPVVVDEQAPVISGPAKLAFLAASDESLSSVIDRLVQVRPNRAAAEPVTIGQFRCTVHPRVSVQDYLNPQPVVDWRYGVTSALNDIVCVVAARTLNAGLLLGSGMVFHGRTIDNTSDELPQGWVMHGPRATLPQGRYRLDMDIELDTGDELTIDIVSQRGLRKLANLDLCGNTKINLGFAVGDEDQEIEVRMVNLGPAPLIGNIRTIVIRRA